MSGANRLASSGSGDRNTGALTCPSPLAALQDVEGISILLSRTRESLLSEAVRKFVDRLRPHYKSFEMKPLFILVYSVIVSLDS